MSIDDIDWHCGDEYPDDLPEENGGTHIGMYLAWIVLNGLEHPELADEVSEALEDLRARRMTGRDFLLDVCDGKLVATMLNMEAREFTGEYYASPEGYGPYLEDYERELVGDLPSLYHVEDTWEGYDRLAPAIDRAYAAWKAARPARR